MKPNPPASLVEAIAGSIKNKAGESSGPLSEAEVQDLQKMFEQTMGRFDPPARKRIVKGVAKILNVDAANIASQIAETKAKSEALKEKKAAFALISAWLDSIIANGPILESNSVSRLHKIHEIGIAGKIIGDNPDETFPGSKLASWKHTFVVKHNWAMAFNKAEGFEGAEGLDGDLRLPYEMCTFEFRINGRSVIALAWDHELGLQKYGQRLGFSLIVEANGKWWDYGGTSHDDSKNEEHDPVFAFVWKQIRAISIALEAEVAVHEVVRAPVALNEKRARTGKPPLRDYYVIDLARRHRVANPSTPKDDDDKRRVRLHFRRGHWRHYESSKTWIKWMLVGNPDLGFIQKRYSL